MSNQQDEEVTTSFIQQPNNRQPASKKKKKRKPKKTRSHQDETKSGLWGLFRYAGPTELALSATGLFFSVLHGASFPILALVFGQMTNTFMRQATFGFKLPANISIINEDIENNTNTFPDPQVFSTVTNPNISNDSVTSASDGAMTPDEFTYFMGTFSLYYLYIGFGVLTASFIQTYCWELACERQIYRLRQIFFAQILRQDITWYDSNKHGDLNTKLSDDLERIREGMGSKFSMVTQYLATFISGISVGMYANWRLTSVILAAGPLLVGTSAFMARASATSSAREQLKYSIAGGVAEEVLTCIRTVAAFGGEIKETKRYGAALDEGRILAMKKYYVMSLGLFFVFFVMYASYGLAFWYGSELIASGLSDPGSVFTVFFSVMAGAFSIGNALPYINAVSTAVGAASNIFGIIDRVPDIDPYSDEGIIPDKCLGEIELIDAEFSYPTRPQVPVLGGLNIKISAGQTVAIVGPSGSGKSTIMSLIQRFYDPKKGKVLIDGIDASLLNLKWLRKNIGIVSQEPVLFGVSILENIQYGRDNITFDEVVAAATLANADSFIKELPQGYNTLVGERGAQLSGGQKQRIAIARAVVRDPRILLLDEATSALDAHSESLVQEALDNASRGRTTVIVAHRLSTIRPANTIYAMMDGKVLEFGTHEELMAKEGLYSSLVTAQSLTTEAPDLTPGDGAAKNYLYKRGISLTNSTDSGIANVVAKKREEVPEVPVHRLLKLNSPEWVWLTAGLLACSLTGAIMPIFAFFYGQVFSTFTLTGDDLKSAAVFWSCMFVLLGFMSGFSYWCQVVCMATAAEKLVARLRYLAMKNILRQPISWFDEEEFSSGHLITRLARDAPLVKAAAGLRAGQVLTAAVTLVAALTIAFIYGWKLALLLLVAIPFLIFAAYHQTMLLRGTQKRDTDLLNQAGRLSSECVKNIITVQSLGKEELFLKLYTDLLLVPYRENKKHAFVYGIVFAFSQAVIYMMYAGAFRFGAYLIQIGDMVPSEVYRVFFALAFCATSVGQGSAYLQDFTKAKYAAKMIFQLIDKKSEIDPTSASGARPDLRGKVTLKGVELRYPSRPDVAVLRCLDLTIKEGQTVALVGGSGCGKTSVIALLERFYTPSKGCIMIDDIDIRAINLSYLRSQIGLVTQEPVLFDCSIRENIAYGALALGGNVTDQDIINAARIANIHDFIVSLPQGYETPCGERGTQLSGGQKQRIAIARALIRDPKILLLDEATSALDTENEKIVQEALDKARQGRTSIVIAHRLSTIQNADQIAVIQRGKVVELGTHEELKTKHGIYHELIKRQNL